MLPVTALALLVACAAGCGANAASGGRSWRVTSDDWAAWNELQEAEGWPAANRDILSRGVVDALRFQIDSIGDEPVQALLPVVMVLESLEGTQAALMAYPLDRSLWESADRADRAAAVGAAGETVRQNGRRPIAVFIAATGWKSSDSSSPSTASDRQRVLLSTGLWADGTRASSIQTADAFEDGSLVLSLPTTDTIFFDVVSDSDDGGGLLAAFYKGYFHSK